jgi:multisubunit Na+/H+ antiporter MnhG subunit
MGISAMGRDEKLPSYLLRLVITVVSNFTIGMIGAVIGFMWSLYAVIQSYKASILVALFYFMLASMAAIAFAMTWIIGDYTI